MTNVNWSAKWYAVELRISLRWQNWQYMKAQCVFAFAHILLLIRTVWQIILVCLCCLLWQQHRWHNYVLSNWQLKYKVMDEEFGTWDCTWYWDNSYADLLPVGKSNLLVLLCCIVEIVSVISATFVLGFGLGLGWPGLQIDCQMGFAKTLPGQAGLIQCIHSFYVRQLYRQVLQSAY